MAENDSKSSIMRKLDYLDNTKHLVRNALREKGQEVPAYVPFRDYAQVIRDMEIGTDTSDADATEYDIIAPHTAYAGNRKITGQISKVEDDFSFDDIEITQRNDSTSSLIKDYNMIDGQVFHKEYFEGINLDGKDFLIYMRQGYDESQAIVFTWDNTEDLELILNNNTMHFESPHLITYTDLFLQGNPTITEGPYTGNYFGNYSYFSTRDVYEEDSSLIFEQQIKLNYKYLTIRQKFDETKAITSQARNKVDIEQTDLAKSVGLVPDILRSGNKILGIEGNLEPTKLFTSYQEMDSSLGNNNDDYAVLYHEEIKDITGNNDIVTTRYIPDTIVMDEEVTTDYTTRLYLSDLSQSYITSNSIYITPDYIEGELRVQINTGQYYTYVYCEFRYSSNDGINYNINYKTDNLPLQVYLRSISTDPLNILPKLLKVYDYGCEGIYQYSNKTDEEIFNSITDIKCIATTTSGNTTYSYYSENEKMRLPKLREVIESCFIEEDKIATTSSNYYSVFKTKSDNKIHLINKRAYLIYNHTADKTYLCIESNNYSERIIDQYTSKYSTKGTKSISQKINDSYYIIGELNTEIIFITEGYYYLTGMTPFITTDFYVRAFLNNEIITISTTNIKYNNTPFEAYHNIDINNNLTYRYQLGEGITAIGQHGAIRGDGSYFNHITNRQFANNYLRGNTSYSAYNKCVIGDLVPSQTFVSNKQIKANYKTGVDIDQGDEVTYHNESSIYSSIDLNDESFLDEYNNCEFSTVYTTFYNNEIPYYIKIKFDGAKESDTELWNNITKVTAVIFNQLTGEIFKTFKCTTAFRPTDISNSTNHQYCGYMQNCGYSFSEDKLYILFSTGSWGWSNAAYGSIISISNTGVLTRTPWTFTPTGGSVQTYKQIDQSGSYWDDVNNQFYAYIETFNSGGSDTRYNGIARINMSGVTQIKQNTDSTVSMYASNSRGQGPLFQYKDGSSKKYVLYDASNNTIILQNMESSLNIIGINGYQFYVYNGNLYKYNPSTHSATIINNEFTGTKVNRLFVDGIEYLHDGNHEGKIYDTDGNFVKDITNVSVNENIEEIDEYHRKIISNYSYYQLEYSSGSRIVTKYDYIRTYKKWFEVKSFPYEGELWITFNSTSYPRMIKGNKSSAKQLTSLPISIEDLNQSINITREVLGINE